MLEQCVSMPLDHESSAGIFSGNLALESHYRQNVMYDRESKKCVPNYNFKSMHKKNIQPFFSESTSAKMSKLKEIQRYNLDDTPDLPEAGKMEQVTSGDLSGKGRIVSIMKSPGG